MASVNLLLGFFGDDVLEDAAQVDIGSYANAVGGYHDGGHELLLLLRGEDLAVSLDVVLVEVAQGWVGTDLHDVALLTVKAYEYGHYVAKTSALK